MEGEILAAYSTFSDTTLVATLRHCTGARQGYRSWLLTQPLVTWWDRTIILPVLFACNRIVIVLNCSVLLGCTFPDPLARKSRFFWCFFGQCLLTFPGCCPRRKLRKFTIMSFFESLASLLSFTLLIHSSRKRKKYVYSIFPQVEVSAYIV